MTGNYEFSFEEFKKLIEKNPEDYDFVKIQLTKEVRKNTEFMTDQGFWLIEITQDLNGKPYASYVKKEFAIGNTKLLLKEMSENIIKGVINGLEDKMKEFVKKEVKKQIQDASELF